MENGNSFTVLFDYDSMIYKAINKVATSLDYKTTIHPNSGLIRKWFREKRNRNWMEKEIVNLAINRLANMGDGILLDIEDTGINIVAVEYFLTACKKSKRKMEVKTYKEKRKRNKWVSMVRKELLGMSSFIYNDEWEADDLIKDRAVELGEDNYVICSMDKDLKQIPGIHFDYYRPRLKKNPDGSHQTDANGFRIVPPCRGLDIISEKDAELFYWRQMLMGDSGDGIKGIPRVGKVKAKKILDNCDGYFNKATYKAYMNYFGTIKGYDEFKKHQLLIGLGVKHRPENKDKSYLNALINNSIMLVEVFSLSLVTANNSLCPVEQLNDNDTSDYLLTVILGTN